MNTFLEIARHNAEVGSAVRELKIDLPRHLSSVATLRHCLELAFNVEDLVLFIPSSRPLSGLMNIILPKLLLLKTNLNYRNVARLLSINPSICYLNIGECSKTPRQKCPINRTQLANIIDISAPLSCLKSVHSILLECLTTTSIPRQSTSITSTLRGFHTLPGVRYLMLDFVPQDSDILRTICCIFPNVRKLRLFEWPVEVSTINYQTTGVHLHSLQCGTVSREWNNLATWRDDLFNLKYLEEFVLGTPVALVNTLGSKADEEHLISTWATRLVGASASASTAHPSLYHLGLYYGGQSPSDRFLSHWYRAGG